MRIFVMLLVLVPMVSFAKCETPIDCYKQALEDLQDARAEIEAVKKDADAKMESIDKLIIQYQAKLEETTKQMTSEYKEKLDKLVIDHEAMEKAYKKKLDGNDELSALSLKAVKENQAESQKLLEEFGTSGEEVKKLTDAVSVSEDGKVLLTDNSYNRLEISDNDDNINIEFVKASNEKKAGAIKFDGYSSQTNNYKTEMLFSSRTNNGESYIWDMILNGKGNVGIGTTEPSSKLQVNGDIKIGADNNTEQSKTKTYGNKLYFLGAHYNTDILWMARYNHSNNGSELRVNIGDDGNDKFAIGKTSPRGSTGKWTSFFTVTEENVDIKGDIKAKNYNSTSDQRLKQNIEPLASSLSKLSQLRGVSFKWKDNPQDNQIGLVAQEVEKILPEIVSTDSEGYKSIAYGKLTAILIEGMKEQQRQIDELKK